jgi:hypothetical protein
MSFCGVSGLGRSSLMRLLLTALLPIALVIVSASAHAQQGANGMDGADCFTSGCFAGNGTDGESVTGGGNAVGGNGGNGGSAFGETGGCGCGFGGNGGNGGSASASGTAVGGAGGNAGDFQLGGDPGFPGNGGDAVASGSGTVTAIGGAGGQPIFQSGIGFGGAGGNATATSSASASDSGNATSSATATGGAAGEGRFAQPGNATANASAFSGSGGATASAIAMVGAGAFSFSLVANATSYAETAEGGLAQAEAEAEADIGLSQSTAKTTFGGVSVQSTAETGVGSTEAIAQGGSGQSPVNPGFVGLAFATALPNAAYATTLIGSASNVADALLGPGDKIFGTAILEEGFISSSSTFDFSFRGDLILGVITGGFSDIVANGTDIPFENVGDNSVINLGSIFGPNIDLAIEGDSVFAIGGAVPEPSTWVMLLLGFAGLALVGYCQAKRFAQPL